MSVIGHSIQEYLKRINSSLTNLNCISILATTLCLIGFTGYLYYEKAVSDIPVSYIPHNSQNVTQNSDPRPFASIDGKTYTFFWCQNSGIIKNRIYFNNEESAQKSGRTLSKLCQK